MRLQSQLSVTFANVKNKSFPLPYEVPRIGGRAGGRPPLDKARSGGTHSPPAGPFRGRRRCPGQVLAHPGVVRGARGCLRQPRALRPTPSPEDGGWMGGG